MTKKQMDRRFAWRSGWIYPQRNFILFYRYKFICRTSYKTTRITEFSSGTLMRH